MALLAVSYVEEDLQGFVFFRVFEPFLNAFVVTRLALELIGGQKLSTGAIAIEAYTNSNSSFPQRGGDNNNKEWASNGGRGEGDADTNTNGRHDKDNAPSSVGRLCHILLDVSEPIHTARWPFSHRACLWINRWSCGGQRALMEWSFS